jgi:hypothetical protein
MNSSMNSIALQDRDPSTFGPLPMAPHSEGSTTSEGDSVPREETSESYSDDDEDQAAADAFDGVLESAVRALQDRWNGASSHHTALHFTCLMFSFNFSPPLPLPDGDRAGTGGRDFVYADSSKSARVK